MIKIRAENNVNQRLQKLVVEARIYPDNSPARQQKLNEIVELVTRSDKLWQDNSPYFEDALQQTWLYFCRNIDRYDETKCNVITWLNNCLKWRLQDFFIAEVKRKANIANWSESIGEEEIDLIQNLPASPEIPPILEETYLWVQTDPARVLRQTHIKGCPEVTCQVIILRRLPPEISWKDIALEFNLPLSTAPNFYRRECLPMLRRFAHKQGYIEIDSA